MRIVSFNVNSIRARLHQLEAITRQHAPEIVALQETKVSDDEFPVEAVQELGYAFVDYYGQKGHYGVALLSRLPPEHVQLGFPWGGDDQQRRFQAASYRASDGTRLTVLNGYFPQGERRDHPVKFPGKARFYEDIARYLEAHCDPADALLLAGDMNIAPEDEDIGIGEDNARRWLRTGKTSFLPEEREWLKRLTDWGLTDSYAHRVARAPEPAEGGDAGEDGRTRRMSWFDYRSRGFERSPKRGLRIDLILLTQPLLGGLGSCGVDYEIRSLDKPSDHCPVWCDLSL